MTRRRPPKRWGKKMGLYLQSIRRKAGLSQADLAKLSGISPVSIRNWEQGKRQPLVMAAVRLAEVLHVTVEQLVGASPLPKK
jgi:transcriptional regulator with XRE-family HTH domain